MPRQMHTTAAQFDELDRTTHGFFTRQGGVSEGKFSSLNCGWKSGDKIEHVAENRRRIAAALAVAPEHLLTCHQIHSGKVIEVTESWDASARLEGDAMVTTRPGLALGILSADCAPVLLIDPAARIIGAAHAGWRGVLQGVIENTIAAMRALGAQPDRLMAAIGPCIWQESYETGPEFPAPFLAHDSGAARFFIPSERAGHFKFDLPGLTAARLQSAGVVQIAPSPADTFAHPEYYFSYRRSTLQQTGNAGSLMSALVLKP